MQTLLVVEDEWAIADWLEVLLSEHAYHVLVASDGRQALDILHREKPDLVLTDFMMPVVDGAGLISAMADNPRTCAIPVVVMTSLAENAVQQRVRSYHGFLRKPFHESELLQILKDVLPPAAH